jgi:hypothetical protein
LIAACIGLFLIAAYMILRPKKAIAILAEKAQYNALFDAPFSSLPGPLMKMPADHLRPLRAHREDQGGSGQGGSGQGGHQGGDRQSGGQSYSGPPALPVLVPVDDIVPVVGQIPIWGDETVTEKAEPRIDEQSMDIKRLIAEREAFTSAIEKEMASALKTAPGATGPASAAAPN